MSKISRNSLCGCGSGKKYKWCCGSLSSGPQAFPREIFAKIDLESRRATAQELRRRLMQGRGRPIIAFESNGYTCIAVGNEIRWSKNWKTFVDFLFDYIKALLTPDWGNAELAKPELDQHTLIHWYKKVCSFQKDATQRTSNGIYAAEATGAVKAYLGLAYDLYLCAHNASLQEALIRRLKNRDQFEGALYEARVIGYFAKAGFSIEFEDEGDVKESHCEFTAIHSATGQRYSVEAKAISSRAKRAGNGDQPPRIRGPLYKALRKRAKHRRIVFIELNRAEQVSNEVQPAWLDEIRNEIRSLEVEITIGGEAAPEAYVWITNCGYLHALDDTRWSDFFIIEGFHIKDFPPERNAERLLDVYNARNKHLEAHWLSQAMHTHRDIPVSFDSRTPEEAFSDAPMNRLRIGDRYIVPDEKGNSVEGVLQDAVVIEHEAKAYGTYLLDNNTRIVCSSQLTRDEMAAYKRDPDTFFEISKPVPKQLNSALECFDFIAESYMNSSREKLLEFMSDWPNLSDLQKLDQKTLAELYCEMIASSMWNDIRIRSN